LRTALLENSDAILHSRGDLALPANRGFQGGEQQGTDLGAHEDLPRAEHRVAVAPLEDVIDHGDRVGFLKIQRLAAYHHVAGAPGRRRARVDGE
jgi:hypothetical protein